MGYPDRSIEDSSAESCVDYKGRAEEVSKGKNISSLWLYLKIWVNVLTEEISKEPIINCVTWS